MAAHTKMIALEINARFMNFAKKHRFLDFSDIWGMTGTL